VFEKLQTLQFKRSKEEKYMKNSQSNNFKIYPNAQELFLDTHLKHLQISFAKTSAHSG